jgi:hypothetical protein
MRATRLLTSALVLGLVAGCKDGSGPEDPTDGGNPPGEPVTVGLSCQAPAGGTTPCDLDLGNATGFRITLVSAECKARTTVVRLTKPTEEVLTDNGCHATVGRVWDFDAPSAPPKRVSLEITAAAERNSAQLRVEGSASPWTIQFEDGFDDDFNDIILRIETR